MRLVAEFTTEPFRGEGEPPAHAVAAFEAGRAAGLECDFGPFGSTIAGDADEVVLALGDVLRAALAHNASAVTLRVEVTEPEAGPTGSGGDGR